MSLHGDRVTSVPDDLAVVFQDYSRSLFPWLSVAKNVEFPLRWSKLDKATRRARAAEALEAVGLSAAVNKYPWQLSGGMQQRVSIARALASRPALLLMDEPFASVDAQTRFELEDLLRRVQVEQSTTVLLVTHDIDESVYLGDRVLVLSKSPARIVADLKVDLPAQRDQITTRESAEFVSLRGEVARLLHGAYRAGGGRSGGAGGGGGRCFGGFGRRRFGEEVVTASGTRPRRPQGRQGCRDPLFRQRFLFRRPPLLDRPLWTGSGGRRISRRRGRAGQRLGV